MSLSYTAIREYERCPRAFKFRYVDGKKGVVNEAVEKGKALHRALELYVKHLIKEGKDSDVEMGQKIVRLCVAKFEDWEELVEVFVNYISGFKEDRKKVVGIEEEVGVDEDFELTSWYVAYFRGVLDKVYYDNGVVVVVDYKTGERIDYDKRQFWAYGILATEYIKGYLGKTIKQVVGKVIFPRHCWEEEFIIRKEDIENAKVWLTEVGKTIEEDEVFAGKVGEHCLNCPYRFMCDEIRDVVDKELLEKTRDKNVMAEEYFKLKAQFKLIEGWLKEETKEESVVYNGHRIGYVESKSYIWDVSAVLKDIIERNMVEDVLKINTQKALKYDWLRENGLIGVKKSSKFEVRKA